MQVNDMRKKARALFENVKVGEVFIWDGEFWMKTRMCTVAEAFCNAVNITDGTFLTFENPQLVEKLDTELIIR